MPTTNRRTIWGLLTPTGAADFSKSRMISNRSTCPERSQQENRTTPRTARSWQHLIGAALRSYPGGLAVMLMSRPPYPQSHHALLNIPSIDNECPAAPKSCGPGKDGLKNMPSKRPASRRMFPEKILEDGGHKKKTVTKNLDEWQ